MHEAQVGQVRRIHLQVAVTLCQIRFVKIGTLAHFSQPPLHLLHCRQSNCDLPIDIPIRGMIMQCGSKRCPFSAPYRLAEFQDVHDGAFHVSHVGPVPSINTQATGYRYPCYPVMISPSTDRCHVNINPV